MKAGDIAKALGKKLSTISNHLKKLIKEGVIYSPKYGVYSIEPKGKRTESDESGESQLNLIKNEESSAMFD